ncbi:aldehyde dehydrogenase family protein [bacterium]|nr:aldehyde dehydrogenase family protein [bacterium]
MLEVVKTNKLFIAGEFVRSESGKVFEVKNIRKLRSSYPKTSKKDLRNAVEATVSAQKSWTSKSSYNRGQILYRMAEMLTGRYAELESIFKENSSLTKLKRTKEINLAIDSFIYYAGFSDKCQQLLSNINPVASSHLNYSIVSPIGPVAFITSQELDFKRVCQIICSTLVAGNTITVLLQKKSAFILSILSEVFATSDLPKGVVNLLTCEQNDLLEHVCTHREIKAVIFDGAKTSDFKIAQKLSADNLKRIIRPDPDAQSLTMIAQTIELKTVWQTIGV